MESLAFTVIALGVLGFGLISGRVQRSIITAPMVFVLFGLLVSEHGLGLVEFQFGNEVIHLFAEFADQLVI